MEGIDVRVRIDYDSCDSNGLCAQAAPEVFEVRDDDLLYVLQERPPEPLWDAVQEAERACPKFAIRLERE
ncbi:ferredoxin [Micromonospora sp. R77]|uniref:ferredoxin n=1 Tax=Micromonospora sp. R77 TaxID=2925836 RepID=UPI001F611898|nr:ferredoxin [Micromonospora sp. R77]MCI4066457.1 ferredoxin [Micromonospora sp. R77]